jgi:cellulose synthase/poly-beta-1,6-N-acetylglucosamine synthase-like glycosyltransferase/peptidoglycan/xylan/chitin deacetylase (PgdA/CDA1 family)
VSRIVTLSAVAITLSAWALAVLHVFRVASVTLQEHHHGISAAALAYVVLTTVLVAGSLTYLSARYGYARRVSTRQSASDVELDAFCMTAVPSATILIPSYKEDPALVRKTVLSAALQDYPRRSIVLLIDDPPIAGTHEDAQALDEMRELADAVASRLEAVHARASSAAAGFARRADAGRLRLSDEARELAALYQEVAAWFADEARRHRIVDHTDRIFVEVTLLGESRRYRQKAADLLDDAEREAIDEGLLRCAYRRLASRFQVTVRTFERKRYTNLSHEPNKAMNLNTYIALMGGRFREWADGSRLLLQRVSADERGIAFDDSDCVVVLDADTVVHPEYVLRLAHGLSQPEHCRVAVIQTPYSAFPGSARLLETVAGATTDIQYQVHQGFTYFGATFWVGANAMIRKAALEEIVEVRHERGFEVRVFIHDRTVIEDTESTVDLRRRGWQLYNYPERMAFSATPADFGALLIQRRRWANGGLLIVPKLWRFLLTSGGRRAAVSEVMLRLHYLTSLAVANVALLVLLGLAFDERLTSVWLPLTAAPYYLLYAVDLRSMGYQWRDVLRVYALNLLLIPVNLGGVLRSVQQAFTGRRSTFGRTPKVAGRTAAPAGYVLAEAGLLGWWTFGALMELEAGHRLNGLFAFANAAFLMYAFVRFVGLREACEDLQPLVAHTAHVLGTPRLAWALRRFGAPLVVALALLFPSAVTGTDLAITIDDLPTHGPLPPGLTRQAVADQVIEALRRHKIRDAVGFVNGGQIVDAPEHGIILEHWIAAGYRLGNHTFGHVDLDRTGSDAFLADVERNEPVIAQYGGTDPDRMLRYPYLHEGATLIEREGVRRALRERRYQIVPVTVDFYDWAWNEMYARCAGRPGAMDALTQGFREASLRALDWSEETADTIVRRPIKQILLLHVSALVALTLDDLLSAYEARGVRFISVRDALEDPVYGIDPRVTWQGQENFLTQLLRATGRPRPRPPLPREECPTG